ncbi:ParB family chromosome partitioning protein [Paraburkholderia sp. BL27I4N3]|uniref:ParB/RepB/Spo0J family partition protein n=1 Tax=Paraburkholderia sp. BL27I4N3 TaxID=1938805 RepID=UPI000E22A95D|nr:ParB/RepB/Spo0J family partition protein [Paraburkholderia sp. BL27I4N3]REE06582.1 ParB family chromosome partitioning protein [Paraburkholderia sp. BL27I4N3]
MSIKEKMAAKTAAIAPLSRVPRPADANAEPKTGPGKFLAAMPILAEKDRELEAMSAENAELREKLATGARGGVDIPLDQLFEVPGRRRYMPKAKYFELRENLRKNKLIHPVVVRPRAEGGFEIVSGHHRTDAYREIGREHIRCVLEEVTEEEATSGAFYANLLQSDLTDYEKHLGFKRMQERHPDITQAEMAEHAGVDPSLVSRFMAFNELPSEVIDLLSSQPDLLGATAGAALATITRDGRGPQVVEAVRKLALKEIDERQAVKVAAAKSAPASTATPAINKIKVGRSVYCEMRTAKNVVRLQFQSDEEAIEVSAAIKAVLESRAAGRAKPQQDD